MRDAELRALRQSVEKALWRAKYNKLLVTVACNRMRELLHNLRKTVAESRRLAGAGKASLEQQ